MKPKALRIAGHKQLFRMISRLIRLFRLLPDTTDHTTYSEQKTSLLLNDELTKLYDRSMLLK